MARCWSYLKADIIIMIGIWKYGMEGWRNDEATGGEDTSLKLICVPLLYLCTLGHVPMISPWPERLRPNGARIIKIMCWSKRSPVRLVWTSLLMEQLQWTDKRFMNWLFNFTKFIYRKNLKFTIFESTLSLDISASTWAIVLLEYAILLCKTWRLWWGLALLCKLNTKRAITILLSLKFDFY